MFLLYNQSFYRISFQTIPANSTSIESTWLLVFLFANEQIIMKYKNESQKNLEENSIMLLGLTSGIAFVITIVSVIIINLVGKSIGRPLEGIKTMTDRINSGEINIESELNNLEEGTEQVSDLVQAFKSLVTTISQRRHAEVPNRGKKKIYPPNELYKTEKIVWKEFLKNIPN